MGFFKKIPLQIWFCSMGVGVVFDFFLPVLDTTIVPSVILHKSHAIACLLSTGDETFVTRSPISALGFTIILGAK